MYAAFLLGIGMYIFLVVAFLCVFDKLVSRPTPKIKKRDDNARTIE